MSEAEPCTSQDVSNEGHGFGVASVVRSGDETSTVQSGHLKAQPTANIYMRAHIATVESAVPGVTY